MGDGCPFCSLGADRIVWQSDLVVAIRDGYPVSPGHTLVIPTRHVQTWFNASPWEQQEIWRAINELKASLDQELKPDGYNIGINAGAAAGQTVMHLHVHLIPRFTNDVPDPRGGVRGVIPSKQQYDSSAPPDTGEPHMFAAFEAFIPGQERPFLEVLRHGFRIADRVDLVAAFVQRSGIELIEGPLTDALDRGAQIRVLTGDYLGVTDPLALQRLYTLTTGFDALQARLYRVREREVFHPKAYLFARGSQAAAWVGSSNLSRSALTDGVEWNLRTSHRDQQALERVQQRFDKLFHSDQAQPLTAGLVQSYQSRIRARPAPEPEARRPTPHDIQREVLDLLTRSRAEGHRRGLVVMATGLGKTYLSAFDFDRIGGRRALFVAHRKEILNQAAATWSRVHPDRTIGFLVDGRHEPDADLVFASVQTLSKVRHLRGFDSGHFDYVVVDEFHHAAANSYRKLLGHFEPTFLLGLTATPDRMDGAALLELCDDNLVARVSLMEGIARRQLVPFRYFGVRDELDFSVIPWRSGRFDKDELTRAQSTKDRAEQALREYLHHAPEVRRSLVFCCSRRHADFIAAAFREAGIAAQAVHSGPTSAPRAESIERLRRGELEAIVAVDIFNEGIDLPDVNTILMLRPTESPIVFLQQLGRGLRRGTTLDKPHLTVIDFIGNHRSFLVKPQALLALTGVDAAPGDALRRIRDDLLELPEGCSVEIDTQALDLLEKVARISKEDQLVYTYQQLRNHLGRRPTATEVFADGTHTKPIKDRYGTWFHFVDAMEDLQDDERDVLTAHDAWFRDLTKMRMNRSYKMVALDVLDELDALHDAVQVPRLAERCRERMRRDPRLRVELAEHESAGGSLDDFTRRWREMPLRILHQARGDSQRWFELDGDVFRSLLQVDEAQREVFDAMTREIVELRLREFLTKKRTYADQVLPFSAPVELVVSHSSGRPILRFDRARAPHLPTGEVLVSVDGEAYRFRFVKIAVNVVTEVGGSQNVLPRLMRRWFGPTAGQPGTRHRVELHHGVDGSWTLEKRVEHPSSAEVIPLHRLPFYPELAVACGVALGQYEGHDVSVPLSVDTDLDVSPSQHFVVRATGDSMDGGALPIQDGDLVLCRWLTVSDPREVEGTPVLLAGGTTEETFALLKIPVRADGRWVLRSANPGHPDQELEPGVTLRVVGRPIAVVEERVDPVLWGLYDRDAIAAMFGHDNNPSWRTGHRDVEVDGEPHTILMVNLVKPKGTKLEHRYDDVFLAPDLFQWESQSTTSPKGAKGRRILNQAEDDRRIHLFVRFHTKDADGRGEPYAYCGLVRTLRHEGSRPIRVWFKLDSPLPETLWRAWSHF